MPEASKTYCLPSGVHVPQRFCAPVQPGAARGRSCRAVGLPECDLRRLGILHGGEDVCHRGPLGANASWRRQQTTGSVPRPCRAHFRPERVDDVRFVGRPRRGGGVDGTGDAQIPRGVGSLPARASRRGRLPVRCRNVRARRAARAVASISRIAGASAVSSTVSPLVAATWASAPSDTLPRRRDVPK